MRVALDARWLQQSPLGGVGRTVAHVLPLLREDVELHLLTDGRRPPIDIGLPEHPLSAPLSGRSSMWLQVAAPQWLRGFRGLFHCPFYGLPFRQPVPMVVTLHDLTFEHHPEWFSPATRIAFRVQARHAVRSAAAILTVSQYVRDDIMRTYGVDGGRIVVAPHGVDPIFLAARPTDMLESDIDPRAPYVVTLAGAARRNAPVAVEAWRRAVATGHRDLRLVVVGSYDGPSEPGLIRAEGLPDAAWARVLAGARAFLYATFDEGFGLPALEAAAVGTPVICAPVGALPEVLGDAAAWADALTPDALAARLLCVLDDEAQAAGLGQRGRTLARAQASWAPAAAAWLAAYRMAEARNG